MTPHASEAIAAVLNSHRFAIRLALGAIFVLNLANTAFLVVFIRSEARKMADLLADLKTEIHQITSVKAAIKAAFDGLSAKIAALAAQPSVDPADLAALAAELHSDNTDFAALITVNTPLDPAQVAVTQGATSSAVAPVTPPPAPDAPAPVEALKGG